MASTGNAHGAVVSLQTIYELSQVWYQGRMDEDWEPPTPVEMEARFAAVGLTDEFWRVT